MSFALDMNKLRAINILIINNCLWKALLLSEELANVPFLVLGNKIDLGRAASEEDLRYQLGLYETYGKEVSSDSKNANYIMQNDFSSYPKL